jgi:DNA-binding MarR family transcriptional regulator
MTSSSNRPQDRTINRPDLLVGGTDREFRSLVQELFGLAAGIEAVTAGFAAMIGLSSPQYSILVSVRHLEGPQPVGITKLARYLRLSAPFVALEVAKLVRLGLLRKEADSKDGRRVQLTVTPKGRERLAKLAPDQAQVNDIIFQNLSTEEFKELRRLLGKLALGSERGIALLEYMAGDRELRAAG